MKSIFYLVLVTIILMSQFGCATLSSIDMGLYEITEEATETDIVTGDRVLSFADRQAQIKKGDKLIQDQLIQFELAGVSYNENYDSVAFDRILRIFKKVHSVSHLRDEQWQPILLAGDEFNAFTTGGTYIVIYSGLEKELRDDAELANVIAHEIAHVVANHVGEGQAFQTMNALVGSSTAGRNSFQAAFTHKDEEEADKVGILYCALAGYDPYAGSRVWERMHEIYGSRAGIVQDHPMNLERAENTKRIADQVMEYYVEGWRNMDYPQILNSNNLWQKKVASTHKELAGEGGGLAAALETVAKALEGKWQAQVEETRQQNRAVFIESVLSVSAVAESKPVGLNSWLISIHYSGNIPINEVTIRADFPSAHGSVSILRQLPYPVHPGQTFDVIFDDPELQAYSISDQHVVVTYDSAQPLQ